MTLIALLCAALLAPQDPAVVTGRAIWKGQAPAALEFVFEAK